MVSQVERFAHHVERLKNKFANECSVNVDSLLEAHTEVESDLRDDCVFVSLLAEGNDHGEYERWGAGDHETLYTYVLLYKELVLKLMDKLKRVEDQNSSIDSQMKQLSDRYKLLEQRVKRLEESRLKSMEVQLAFQIYQAIIHYVLSNTDPEQEHICTIGDMEKALRGKSNFADIFNTEDDKQKAELKWEELKRELNWSGKHFRYLKKFEDFHMQLGDPGLLFESQAIKHALENDTLEIQEKELFADCFRIFEKLSKLASDMVSKST